ncbi:MAG: tyrosine-type recombinase/integrase [Phototrophicaceae bacterium]
MPTVNEAYAEMILECRANGRRAETLSFYERHLKPFLLEAGNKEVASITRGDMRRYIAQMRERLVLYPSGKNRPTISGRLSEETINAHIRALSRLWKFISSEYDLESPMRGIQQKRVDHKPKSINTDDFLAILKACDGSTNLAEAYRNKALLLLLADTGLRRSALTTITLESLDLIQRRVIVTEKGGRLHTAFFSHYTASMLRQWLDYRESLHPELFVSPRTGKPLQPSGINQILRRLKEDAQVRGHANPHSFRHGFAIRFIQQGGDIGVLQKLLGHSDISVTAGYYLIFSEDELARLKDEIDVLKL